MTQYDSPTERANRLAKNNNFTNRDEIDAFRHMYAAAKTAGKIGGTMTRLGGDMVEMGGIARYYIKSALGNTQVTWTFTDNERYKDYYNNELGIEIGLSTASEDEIIEKVSEAIRSGRAIVNSDDAKSRFEKDFPQDDQLLENTGDWRLGTGAIMFEDKEWNIFRLFDSSQNQEGATSRMNFSGQAGMPSSSSLAQQIQMSQQRNLGEQMIDLFSGNRGSPRMTTIATGNNSGVDAGAQLTNALFNVFEKVIGDALFGGGRKTRTSTSESSRSLEERQRWSLSRSQQQAELATQAQAGARNL
ncbi:MAG: hypothetical protein AB7F82_06645 [Alphaproteobacteria bacterium]